MPGPYRSRCTEGVANHGYAAVRCVEALPTLPVPMGRMPTRRLDRLSVGDPLHDQDGLLDLGQADFELFVPKSRVAGRLGLEVGPAVAAEFVSSRHDMLQRMCALEIFEVEKVELFDGSVRRFDGR